MRSSSTIESIAVANYEYLTIFLSDWLGHWRLCFNMPFISTLRNIFEFLFSKIAKDFGTNKFCEKTATSSPVSHSRHALWIMTFISFMTYKLIATNQGEGRALKSNNKQDVKMGIAKDENLPISLSFYEINMLKV